MLKCSVIIIWMCGPLLQERLIHECTNSVDSNAAAVIKFLSFILALVTSMFLRRDVNKALLELMEGK